MARLWTMLRWLDVSFLPVAALLWTLIAMAEAVGLAAVGSAVLPPAASLPLALAAFALTASDAQGRLARHS
ncbi:hypothetical protein EAH89_25475 [Roseomonas nepalensis]|uniref:Uncharacterized protein n=1 Tax=Muricoccus nepalensis TaxID=1854500 RepID=A0A502F991_9PROT|nr:hypothetical protein EAH89_25475 [Roseomonas nepalensis]